MDQLTGTSNLCYLTKNNLKRVIPHIDYENFHSLEQIYKTPIFFFSKKEEKVLLGFKEFLKNPESFISSYYKPVNIVDSYQYIYEGQKPAYHAKPDCSNLKSDFTNIVIPEEIKIKGKEEIIRFRKWYNTYLNEVTKVRLAKIDVKNDPVFRQRLLADFKITVDMLLDVQYDNSGADNFNDISLPDLEKKIDTILQKSKFYFVNSTPEEKGILKRFQKYTSLGYLKDEIQNNDTNMSDDVFKDFLRSYDMQFKKPVKKLLLEYYRVQHNPALKFEGSLLEQLNFKPCNLCYRKLVSLDDLF